MDINSFRELVHRVQKELEYLIIQSEKLEKRIEKLEDAIHPQPRRGFVVVHQRVGETREEANTRAGYTQDDFEKNTVFVVQFVDHPVRDSILENT